MTGSDKQSTHLGAATGRTELAEFWHIIPGCNLDRETDLPAPP
ncbi:hypothetical protein [Chitinibacter sp. S2-10]